MDKCIYEKENGKCLALTKKDCAGCSFYKSEKHYYLAAGGCAKKRKGE